MSNLDEMAVIDWHAAAPLLSHASDPATVSLSKTTARFIEGPWFKVAFDHGWVPLELFGYSDVTGFTGLLPMMHEHGLTYICGMDDDAADVMGDMGPTQKIQRFILPRDGAFWWRHERFVSSTSD